MSNAYRSKLHRDGTATVWDVYTQSWSRVTRLSDAVSASMDSAERTRVKRHLRPAAVGEAMRLGLALARALVALPGWRWMRGMAWTATQDGWVSRGIFCRGLCPLPPDWALPDLDDPATGGCLLAMLGDDAVSIALDDRSGTVYVVGEDADCYLSLGRACAAVMVERGRVTR